MSAAAAPKQSITLPSTHVDLADQLAAPVSPTTEKSAAEAQRRTSAWHPPTTSPSAFSPSSASASAFSAQQPQGLQRTFSFNREEHKHAMMAASGALSVGPQGTGDASGYSERA